LIDWCLTPILAVIEKYIFRCSQPVHERVSVVKRQMSNVSAM